MTTHLDQGAFQATNTPSDGAAHEDNYAMHLPFLALHAEGRLPARLRINFLHQDATPDAADAARAGQQHVPVLRRRHGANRRHRRVHRRQDKAFVEAARLLARAGWRAEVHSLSRTDFQQEIQDYEAAHKESSITDLRWVVAHVPFITEDWVNRLKALGGGLSLTSWRYLAGTPEQNGPPFRMIVDNGIHAGMSSDGMQIAPMNPWLHMYYADHRPERAAGPHQRRAADHAPGGAEALHGRATAGSCGRRTGSARSRPGSWRTWSSSATTTSPCRTRT